MVEESEVDILGDFDLDNILSKQVPDIYDGASLVSQNSDLLNCDYTIHPQWLLDKPSVNPDCWYETPDLINTDEMGNVLTENSINDESGWMEKEKNLLERGIEIFGKSNTRLSQFIGSKNPSEVKYYLKNFYTESNSSPPVYNNLEQETIIEKNLAEDILIDKQIPATIEEVICNQNPSTCLDFMHKQNKTIKRVKFKCKTPIRVPQKKQKMTNLKQKKVNKTVELLKRTPVFSDVQITTGRGLSVPICKGEEVVKIIKENSNSASDSEIEVDIDDSKDSFKERSDDVENTVLTQNRAQLGKLHEDEVDILSKLDKNTSGELLSQEIPTCEVILDENFVTNVEKIIHSDFFDGKSDSKTPIKYLELRNHIIAKWNSQKPQYFNKTASREDLDSSIDVNCLGRIHHLLEQIGAINFGCERTKYVRPLFSLIAHEMSLKKARLKGTSDLIASKHQSSFGRRPRNKKKFDNNGEGGCTLTHGTQGEVINTTIVNEEPKSKHYTKKPVIRLIYCRPFPPHIPQKYNVKIHLSALLLMDFHAHSSLSEVMGLIGGYWSESSKTLTITHYESCKNIASSSTHCDMCPISQAKAADTIHNLDLDILGWFHSHPTFAPEPSQQDLDTQLAVQKWIGYNKPCVGIILSPFSLQEALIASPYRCMIVEKKYFEREYVPYKFKVQLVSESFDIDNFLFCIDKIYKFETSSSSNNFQERSVNFKNKYFKDGSMTYLRKFLWSVKNNLDRCAHFNKVMCDAIIDGITDICSGEN